MNKLEEIQMNAMTNVEFDIEDKTPNYLGFAQKSAEITTDVAFRFAEWLTKIPYTPYLDIKPNLWVDTYGVQKTTQELFEIFINNHYGK